MEFVKLQYTHAGVQFMHYTFCTWSRPIVKRVLDSGTQIFGITEKILSDSISDPF